MATKTAAQRRAEADRRRASERAAAAAAAGNGKAEAEAEAAAERAATRRVVLKRERVLVLPEDADDEAIRLALKEAKLPSWLKTKIAEAWTVVGEFEGSKQGAIEAYAGKPNTPDAKPGAYKAPAASAFAGGRLYVRPPEPKVEVGDLD